MRIKNTLKKKYSRLRINLQKIKDYCLGAKNYKKFVIISDARTGSTLLMQLLNFHANIIVLGEEFKNLKGKSCRTIWNEIFRKRPKEIQWVGFKLFYFHPWQSEDKDVWDFIKADEEIIIIHLVRKNTLRSFVSKQIGLKTKKWTENVNRPNSISKIEKKVKLDPDACFKNFEIIDNYRRETAEAFKNHKIISVVYEDLDENKQKEMNRLYKELGVEEIEVSTYMKKQNPERLSDLILNYSELKEDFKGTKWENFLKE